MESNGSSPRPRSPSLGMLLSPPSRVSACAPKTLMEMRRDRSATVSSNGSQMPLLPIGAQKKTSPRATTTSAAYLKNGGSLEGARAGSAGGLSAVGSVMDSSDLSRIFGYRQPRRRFILPVRHAPPPLDCRAGALGVAAVVGADLPFHCARVAGGRLVGRAHAATAVGSAAGAGPEHVDAVAGGRPVRARVVDVAGGRGRGHVGRAVGRAAAAKSSRAGRGCTRRASPAPDVAEPPAPAEPPVELSSPPQLVTWMAAQKKVVPTHMMEAAVFIDILRSSN